MIAGDRTACDLERSVVDDRAAVSAVIAACERTGTGDGQGAVVRDDVAAGLGAFIRQAAVEGVLVEVELDDLGFGNDQRGIVSVLKIRALFEDYGNNVLENDQLVETIEIIENAKGFYGSEPHKLSKADLRSARKTGDKARVEAAKNALKQKREENVLIATSHRIMDELNRFQTPEGMQSLERAGYIYNAGMDGFLEIELPSRTTS